MINLAPLINGQLIPGGIVDKDVKVYSGVTVKMENVNGTNYFKMSFAGGLSVVSWVGAPWVLQALFVIPPSSITGNCSGLLIWLL